MSEVLNTMKVLILGATGSLGKQIVAQALERGHELTALVRNPEKMGETKIRVLTGPLDAEHLELALPGQDAVIFALGTKPGGTTTFFSDTTRLLLTAMQKCNVKRIVAVTGIGSGDSKGHGGFLYDWIVYPLITKKIYEDKDRQETLLKASDREWIAVRPAAFTNGPLTRNWRATDDLRGVTIKWISRADAASFTLDQLTSNEWLRRTPLVGY
jgi:putative NADH-flavin reductase